MKDDTNLFKINERTILQAMYQQVPNSDFCKSQVMDLLILESLILMYEEILVTYTQNPPQEQQCIEYMGIGIEI